MNGLQELGYLWLVQGVNPEVLRAFFRVVAPSVKAP